MTTPEILSRIRTPARTKGVTFALAWAAVCRDDALMPVREYRFHPERKYRFDFAWEKQRVALEIDGAVWTGGGHTTGTGKTRDCEKDFLAAQCGWRVIRWTSSMVGVQNCEALLEILKMPPRAGMGS